MSILVCSLNYFEDPCNYVFQLIGLRHRVKFNKTLPFLTIRLLPIVTGALDMEWPLLLWYITCFLYYSMFYLSLQPPVVSTDTGYVFLMGGDTYNGDTTQRDFIPGLMDLKAENGFKNDGRSHLFSFVLF